MYNGRSPGARGAAPQKGASVLPARAPLRGRSVPRGAGGARVGPREPGPSVVCSGSALEPFSLPHLLRASPVRGATGRHLARCVCLCPAPSNTRVTRARSSPYGCSQRKNLDGFALALDRRGREFSRREWTGYSIPGRGADDDVRAEFLVEVLETRRQVARIPDQGIRQAVGTAYIRGQDEPRVDADSVGKGPVSMSFEILIDGMEPFPHLQCRPHRHQRMVLAENRGTEYGLDLVPDILEHEAMVLPDRLPP